MEEIRVILNAPDLTTRLGVRDRAMMHLCFAGGLRVSELIGVLQENITLGRTPTVMVRGKGRKERCLPLWKETARDVRAWLSVRGEARTPELFVNAEGAAMTRAGFEYVLDKHVRRAAKICPALAGRTVSPRQLRHYLPHRTMSSSCDHNGKYLMKKVIFRRNTRATRHSQLDLQAVQEFQQVVVGPEAG
jgi:integrase/recombinase XerD